MKDAFGQELQIGDYMVYTPASGEGLNMAKITGVTDKGNIKITAVSGNGTSFAQQLAVHQETIADWRTKIGSPGWSWLKPETIAKMEAKGIVHKTSLTSTGFCYKLDPLVVPQDVQAALSI